MYHFFYCEIISVFKKVNFNSNYVIQHCISPYGSNEFGLMEVDTNWQLVQKAVISNIQNGSSSLAVLNSKREYIFELNMGEVVIINENFEVDTTYIPAYRDRILPFPNCTVLNDSAYCIPGEYLYGDITGYWSEPACYIIGEGTTVIDSFIFSTSDSMSNPRHIDFIHPDTLFMAGMLNNGGDIYPYAHNEIWIDFYTFSLDLFSHYNLPNCHKSLLYLENLLCRSSYQL